MLKTVRLQYILLVAALSHCREPYMPQIVSADKNYLVVEGFINAAPGATTYIRLSRTSKVEDTDSIRLERFAQVKLEIAGWGTQSLPELQSEPGTYAISTLQLDPGKQCRLLIKTTDGKSYQSAFVAVLKAPPIDSIGYYMKDKGAQIYVNTADPANNTRYYRWEYETTWEYHSADFSLMRYENGMLTRRTPEERAELYYCWRTQRSSNVLLANSNNFIEDVISKAPLLYIPGGDERLAILLHMRVRQFALTKEAYDFWQQVKVNTEQLGGLFGPLPTAIKGNIACQSDPEEPVIGYVSASVAAEKDRFIESPLGWIHRRDCPIDTIDNTPQQLLTFLGQIGYLPYRLLNNRVLISRDRTCVDCRERGGVSTKPVYWP